MAAICRSFVCFTEITMPTRLQIFAIVAALAAGVSSAAMAQPACPPGYAFYGGVCQPVSPAPGYPSNPVSGAAVGGAAGAANGGAAGGPVGAVVGGAVGTATGAAAGTANMLTGAPAPAGCGYGYHWYNGYCYPNR
jgi:hypothetical protein